MTWMRVVYLAAIVPVLSVIAWLVMREVREALADPEVEPMSDEWARLARYGREGDTRYDR